MKYDINILNKYIADGLVVKQDHPNLPISIYNYSRKCQYESLWDEVTINCRGLVLDKDGEVVAKPFAKFFNYEELKGGKFKTSEIPNESFDVFEKMDGSLGILFNYEGEWIMATRGSFTSEQAIKGMEMLKKLPYERFIENCTYLFEIIYKENRIVVDYDYEDLVLLAIIDNTDGYELDLYNVQLEGICIAAIYADAGFRVVKKYNGITDFEQLKGMIGNDAEGYVIKFKSGMRMKIKGDEYVRLHRILTNVTARTVWEYLKEDKPLDELIERVPDEFDKWLKQTVSNLKYNAFQVRERAGKTYDYFRFGKYGDRYPEPTKKEFAEHLKQYVPPILHPICFAMWDGKPYDHMIWKIVKPKHEKPFKNDN